MQLLADLPWTPCKSSEHEGRVAAFDLHHLCVGVVQRSFLRKPNAHTVLLFFSGATASFSHAVFNGDRRRPVCGPGCACGVRTVRCRHTARAFARGLPLFSEKQTAVTMNAYLALQRVAAVIFSHHDDCKPWLVCITHMPLVTLTVANFNG